MPVSLPWGLNFTLHNVLLAMNLAAALEIIIATALIENKSKSELDAISG